MTYEYAITSPGCLIEKGTIKDESNVKWTVPDWEMFPSTVAGIDVAAHRFGIAYNCGHTIIIGPAVDPWEQMEG